MSEKEKLEKDWNDKADIYASERAVLREQENKVHKLRGELLQAKVSYLRYVENQQGIHEDDDSHE